MNTCKANGCIHAANTATKANTLTTKRFCTEIVQALEGSHEVLLTGAGTARTEFKTWCDSHAKACAHTIIENIPSDHPTDPQLIALARKYFVKFDKMAGDPSLL
jgi:hypothetical protein